MEKLKVSLVKEKQQLYINLNLPTDFDFNKLKGFTPKYLCISNKKVGVKYI